MIYRFRVILDTKEDVFRDIEINSQDTLEDLHNAITQAFGFGGQEVASFYQSNEQWEQGQEYPLFDMSDESASVQTMSNTILEAVLDKDNTKMLYVYDFLNMWTFLVELADIGEEQIGQLYPNLMFAQGEVPLEAPEKQFTAEKVGEDLEADLNEDLDDDLLLDDFDQFY
jgi:hypothetical protein